MFAVLVFVHFLLLSLAPVKGAGDDHVCKDIIQQTRVSSNGMGYHIVYPKEAKNTDFFTQPYVEKSIEEFKEKDCKLLAPSSPEQSTISTTSSRRLCASRVST